MSQIERFKSTRDDGRSHTDVLLACVQDAPPGAVFTHDELGAVLSVGLPEPLPRPAVRNIVNNGMHRFEREYQRTLHCVRGVGYRVALASDHMRLASTRKRRADVQLRKGIHTLRHVRWDEMDENTRKAHEGHLMVTEAIYANQHALEKRLRSVEVAIQRLTIA